MAEPHHLSDSQIARLHAANDAQRQYEHEQVHQEGKEHSPMVLAAEAAEKNWSGGLCNHGRAPGSLNPEGPWTDMGVVLIGGGADFLCHCCGRVEHTWTRQNRDGEVKEHSSTLCYWCHPDNQEAVEQWKAEYEAEREERRNRVKGTARKFMAANPETFRKLD